MGNFSALLREAGPGFEHTIREISQQPVTWPATAERMKAVRAEIAKSVANARRIIFTGSGSSQYAGECVAPALQKDLRKPVEVQGGGQLLLYSNSSVSDEPTLVVSLARSGDSPESAAVVQTLLDTKPNVSHLVLTCNSEGRLAKEYTGNPRVQVVDLGDQVNDRSLVMTSSFTNLVLSGRFLGWTDRADQFATMAGHLGAAGRRLLVDWPDRLGKFVSGDVQRMVFLGSGSRFGAAREASLKLVEMTAGKVATMPETYLGLRHGPMTFINDRTLVVCFLSSDPLLRAYERDLILELNAKKLGARKIVAGVGNPGADLTAGNDLAIDYGSAKGELEDADLALLDVMIGQILGFYRCREEGLNPDSPSASGVISRVVGKFRIHQPEGAKK